MASNVQHSNAFFKRNPFNWYRLLKVLLLICALYLVIFQPKMVGEHVGAWLKLLIDGFKNSFL